MSGFTTGVVIPTGVGTESEEGEKKSPQVTQDSEKAVESIDSGFQWGQMMVKYWGY